MFLKFLVLSPNLSWLLHWFRLPRIILSLRPHPDGRAELLSVSRFQFSSEMRRLTPFRVSLVTPVPPPPEIRLWARHKNLTIQLLFLSDFLVKYLEFPGAADCRIFVPFESVPCCCCLVIRLCENPSGLVVGYLSNHGFGRLPSGFKNFSAYFLYDKTMNFATKWRRMKHIDKDYKNNLGCCLFFSWN